MGASDYRTWGNSQNFDFVMGGPIPTATQLVRVGHPNAGTELTQRPDTWRFFFGLTVNTFPAGGVPWQLDVLFDLYPGLGRSSVIIPGFEHYTQTDLGPVAPGQLLYSTSVISPPKTPAELAAGITHTIDQIVADSISCQVRFLYTHAPPGTALNATVTAFFAPNSNFPAQEIANSLILDGGG